MIVVRSSKPETNYRSKFKHLDHPSLKVQTAIPEVSKNDQKTLVFGALFLLTYIAVRFGFSKQLDSAGFYAGYLFEIVMVGLAGIIYHDRIRMKLENPVSELAKAFIPSMVLGAAAFLATKPLGLVVPFDLGSMEAILFLILIGPVLEEFIFRMALWQPLKDLMGPRTALIGTTLIFAYAHFHAYWFVPAEYKTFVIYQTIYVLGLGFYCGWRLSRTSALTAPLLVHLAFNLGFYLSTKL